ncbi:hypothetical protein [Psychroserpens damuponensis]|uniref:hypothetical protein n=1 Tax=Psychroserpens damuponensis TaxID=943936 RepID=UPI00058D3AB2|nr:hypothetical protein [Psychroserpens damuponensis]
MKKLLFIFLLSGFFSISFAQETPKIGDILQINEPKAQTYHHIDFPKPNILIKRGTVTGYKSVYGTTVVVSKIETNKDGSTYVILKRKDDTKFFGYLSKVKANYSKSIASGELSIP